MKIAIIDDDELVLKKLSIKLSTKFQKNNIENFAIATFSEIEKLDISNFNFDFLIIDFDLGTGKTGVDFIRNHEHCLSNKCCLYTSSILDLGIKNYLNRINCKIFEKTEVSHMLTFILRSVA